MPSSLNAGLVGARRADVRLAVVSLGLAAALGVIGWWQYRSVSDASAAEHDRMQALLASRAAQFERDLDRELTRAFVWLQVDAPSVSGEPRRSLPGRLARWYDESPHPELLKSIYVVRAAEAGPGAPQAAPSTFRFDRDAATLVEAPLPPELQHLRERLAERDRDRDREGGFGGREAPPLDFDRYDWASFVRLVDELEHRLPFVGVRYLVNKVMGPRNAGIEDPRQKRELINRAVDDGVLEMYEVGNVEGRGDPVTACRLDRASPVVVRFLGPSSRAPNVPAGRPGLASDATEASPGDGGPSSGDEAEFQPSADDGGGDDV